MLNALIENYDPMKLENSQIIIKWYISKLKVLHTFERCLIYFNIVLERGETGALHLNAFVIKIT